MPLTEDVATTCSALSTPPTEPAILSGAETEAGASMAWAGTLDPSGSEGSGSVPAAALVVGELVARLAVHAADSSASGTNAVARCRRLKREGDLVADMETPGMRGSARSYPMARCPNTTNRVTSKLRPSPEMV